MYRNISTPKDDNGCGWFGGSLISGLSSMLVNWSRICMAEEDSPALCTWSRRTILPPNKKEYRRTCVRRRGDQDAASSSAFSVLALERLRIQLKQMARIRAKPT